MAQDRAGASPYVIDVTEADFAAQVLARSAKVPVLVDFWASWCAPCKMLGPVLEKAVADLEGRVILAKVDTDRAPALAQRYQIRGIPAVKAFRDGQVVDEFSGARDMRFVRSFLERVAPSEAMQRLDQAAALIKEGRGAEAEAILRPMVEAGGAGADVNGALLLLSDAVLHQGQGRLGEVPALLARIDPRSQQAESAEAIGRLVSFLQAVEAYGGEEKARAALATDEKDLDARFALAAGRALAGEYGEAMEQLLEIISRSRRFKDDGARKALLLLFEHVGPESELTQTHRRRLQVIL